MDTVALGGILVITVGLAVVTICGCWMSHNQKCGLFAPGCPLHGGPCGTRAKVAAIV
jgi:hypothetical protein